MFQTFLIIVEQKYCFSGRRVREFESLGYLLKLNFKRWKFPFFREIHGHYSNFAILSGKFCQNCSSYFYCELLLVQHCHFYQQIFRNNMVDMHVCVRLSTCNFCTNWVWCDAVLTLLFRIIWGQLCCIKSHVVVICSLWLNWLASNSFSCL